MREIKCRSWNDEMKHFEYWDVSGGFNDGEYYSALDTGFPLEFYIGLKDENGEEIYEGDVIEFEGKDEIGVVKFDQQCWGYGLYFPELKLEDLFSPMITWIEGDKIPFSVKGNIHENPNLINKSHN